MATIKYRGWSIHVDRRSRIPWAYGHILLKPGTKFNASVKPVRWFTPRYYRPTLKTLLRRVKHEVDKVIRVDYDHQKYALGLAGSLGMTA